MRKYITCFLLVILILFNCFAVSLNTYANPLLYPILLASGELLSLEALAGGSCLLATQGVTFKDANSSRLCMADFFANMPTVMVQGYKANFENRLFLTKSTIKIAPDVWEYTQNYINSLQIGQSIRKDLDITVDSNGYVNDIKIGTIENPYSLGTTQAYMEISDKVYVYVGDQSWGFTKTDGNYAFNYTGLAFHHRYMNIDYYRHSFELVWPNGGKTGFYYDVASPVGVTVTDTFTGTVDSYYDYTRSGVAIPVPQTLEGDRVITVPKSVPLTGGVSIPGDICIPDVNTLTEANTYTDATTGEVSTTEFRYPEMQVPADVLKNKFPFSIPWDLKNAVTSLMVTPVAPKWVIKFDKNYFVGGGEIVIDFAQFEIWAKIIRWGILIIFNIFLILATRRLVGAS